jgi:hypothetical protein
VLSFVVARGLPPYDRRVLAPVDRVEVTVVIARGWDPGSLFEILTERAGVSSSLPSGLLAVL